MLKVINTFLVLSLLVAGFVVYSLEYSIKQSERQIFVAKNKIGKALDTKRLLDAEWAMLTRPERLQRLASEHLSLKPMRADQVVNETSLILSLPDRPAIDPTQTNKDPIATMLKGLGR